MDILQVKNLSFTYSGTEKQALNNLSMNIKSGSFNLVFGESGCGKSTLFRLCKREISPNGKRSGNILYKGTDISRLEPKISACKIGFVGQKPDEQIVTDKVWHELAFGLENSGLKNTEIKSRVAEMSSYFGINEWYHKNTDELSGGQKQILNLASVMVMQPDILILDEPTSQLDPIAASNFIEALKKLNYDFGLTILIAEHRLEEIFPVADNAFAMENGRIIFSGNPKNVCEKLKGNNLEMSLPTPSRVWSSLEVNCECPLTVRDGRNFLRENFPDKFGRELSVKNEHGSSESKNNTAIEANGIFFRYGKKLPDILENMSLTVNKGEIFSILGGNGCGKTTTLNILSGIDIPYKGCIKILGKRINSYKNNSLYRNTLAYLPQNPMSVFIKTSVREDLADILNVLDIPKNEQSYHITDISQKVGISDFLGRHPYDLSGGEIQKCAIAKILLTNPQIMLLDEPTKGMDAFYKNTLLTIMKALKNEGKTILMVTHDIEFAAEASDRCALFFDGGIVSYGVPNEFFSGNSFYTTSAGRMSRDFFKNAGLCSEIVRLCGG